MRDTAATLVLAVTAWFVASDCHAAKTATLAPEVAPSDVSKPVAGMHSPSATLTVSLVTFGPGMELWERFGHTAIWIHDSRTDTHIAYHYGLFDFTQKQFLLRFVRGQMLYSMGRSSAQEMLATYAPAGRSITLQELNLTATQAMELPGFDQSNGEIIALVLPIHCGVAWALWRAGNTR